jgi:DNA primase
MVPVEPELTWDTAHDYTRKLAERVAAIEPARYTTSVLCCSIVLWAVPGQ